MLDYYTSELSSLYSSVVEFAKEECTEVVPWQRMIITSFQIRKSVGNNSC